ncbi:MAG: hypothetical protein JKY94_09355 [Rhodobacteraceae bacterium]|nr:hypothetical protein [Paracoccaceae bacterium]
MTFDPKIKGHKALLYKALVAAAELANEPFDRFMQTPFDPSWNLGSNYRRNMQRGDYAAVRANVLYDFLLEHHFEAAHLEAPEIFSETPEMRWQAIVNEHAITGKLRIVLPSKEMGIVQRLSAVTNAEATLKLGQPFYFELDADAPGYATSLQSVRNKWHPIGLGVDGTFNMQINAGTNVIPQTASGQPDPLVESHDLGLHQFVVLLAKDQKMSASVDGLLKTWPDLEAAIHRIRVHFVE